MKISFSEKEPKKNLDNIKQQLEGRKLGEMVDFKLNGKNLEVNIRKMGTSTLRFEHSETHNGMQWELTEEKIALAHRAFKGDVMEKIFKLVGQAGGVVVA